MQLGILHTIWLHTSSHPPKKIITCLTGVPVLSIQYLLKSNTLLTLFCVWYWTLTHSLLQQSWIDEMSKYLKQADPNHMITVGEEGFYTKGSTGEAVNPGTGWASLTGQDFIANHASPAIDFAAAHIWPDNWEVGLLLHPGLMCILDTLHGSAWVWLVNVWQVSVECCACLMLSAVLAC